jgi:hypothetical protein
MEFPATVSGMMPVSATTDRLYFAAQEAFRAWCREHGFRFPAPHEAVAAYLRHCAKTRGASAVPVHLSAIAQLYREARRPIDTKSHVIQQVVRVARAKMRR